MLTHPIVVGLTDTHHSDHAVAMGRLLAERFDLEMQLVHAVRERDLLAGNLPAAKHALAEAHLLNAVRCKLTMHLGELERVVVGREQHESLQVRLGHPAEVLVGQARAAESELIMLGSHRRRGFIDFGSTARAILTDAPCAVWVQVDKPEVIRQILAPVDFSDDSLHALELACELGARLNATVTALHCFVPPDFAYTPRTDSTMPTYVIDEQRDLARRQLDTFVSSCASQGVGVAVEFFEGEPISTLLSRQVDTGLIVMATHGRGAVSSAVLGSVTYAVLREANVPVVAVRHPSRVMSSGGGGR